MVIAGNELAASREFPGLGQRHSEYLVIDSEHFALDIAERSLLDLGAFANLLELFGRRLKLDEQTDVVNHAGQKRLIGQRKLDLLGQRHGPQCRR